MSKGEVKSREEYMNSKSAKEINIYIELFNNNISNFNKTIAEQQKLYDSTLVSLIEMQKSDKLKQNTMNKTDADAYAKDQQTWYNLLTKRLEGCTKIIKDQKFQITEYNQKIVNYQLALKLLDGKGNEKAEKCKKIYNEFYEEFKNTSEEAFDDLTLQQQDNYVEWHIAKEWLEKSGEIPLAGENV